MPGRVAPIDVRELRRGLGNFVTGVTIVATVDEAGHPRGLTANSFTSVSLDPPLVLVCIASKCGSAPAFQRCRGFSINILAEDQRRISDVFAGKAPDKFDHVSWITGETGAPRILGSLATLDCRVYDRTPVGDHIILMGEVAAFQSTYGRPLVYGQGGYMPLDVQQAAVSRSRGKDVTVSCILQHGEGVLLATRDPADAQSGWTLPSASLTETGSNELISLKQALSRIGVRAEITFLYSVFEASGSHCVNIVYRGLLQDRPDDAALARLFSAADCPWDALRPKEHAGMLRRYFLKQSLGQFGVYTECEDGGRVARLFRGPEIFETYLTNLSRN